MFKNFSPTDRRLLLAAAVCIGAVSGPSTPARAQGMMMPGHAGHMNHMGQMGPMQKAPPKTARVAPQPPHGGQLSVVGSQTFEAVYEPRGIRVYAYGPFPKAKSTRGITGEVVLERLSDGRQARIPLQYVAPPPGSQVQDHLAATVNLSKIKDGEATVTFKLQMPAPEHGKPLFVQTFALTKEKPTVTVAALAASDQAGVTRQGVCPVTGAALGSMGNPIKVLVGDQPLYLCCQGCVAKVTAAPTAYLRKAQQAETSR